MLERRRMKRYAIALLALLALAPAAAPAAPKHATPPGTCAIVYGPQAIPGDSSQQALILHMDIAPGRTANWHSHPGAEYMSVVSGSGWLEVQGKPNERITPGGVYTIAPNAVHRAHNASSTSDLRWTGFLVLDNRAHQHTLLKNGAGPWTPGCSSRI